MKGKWPYMMLLLAIGMGLGTTYLIYQWMGQQAEAKPKASGLLVKPVVVAAQDLAPGTTLNQDMLKVIKWPWDNVPEGAIGKPEELMGRVVLVQTYAGETLMESKLAAEGMTGGMTAIISPGKRALSVRVNEIIGVAGFVTPGTHVDVLLTIDDDKVRRGKVDAITKTILQNVKVLASGQTVMQVNDEPVLVNVVTLELTLEDSEKLTLAVNRGQLQLALRHQTDDEEVKTAGINTPQLIPAPRRVRKRVASAPAPEPVIVEVIRGNKRTQQKMKDQ